MIEEQLTRNIKKAVDSLNIEGTIELEIPQDPKHGDFSCNIAMKAAKELKKNPRELGQDIVNELEKNTNYQLLVTNSQLAGPGFINFFISDEAWTEELSNIITLDQQFGSLKIGENRKAITDTSHPNVAKPMMVHNTLSTIIGAAINNLLENAGYNVIRDNYMGDWGTQYGKLNYAIKTWGDMEKIKADPIPELLALYIKVHEEAEKDPTIEDAGRAEFKKMEEGNKENLELWKWAKELSEVEFQKGYKRLKIEFDLINGESFYEPMMEAIVKEGQKKGVIIEGEGGALIIPMNDENKPPAIIKKSDGTSLYATRDLARIKYWQDELEGDMGVNVVDVAQKLYFEQLFESAEKLGLNKMKHVHVIFGRMEFPDKGMSTRKGNVVLFEDLLDEAEKRALNLIKEHNSKLQEDEQIELARIMGIGAIKYHILSQSRHKKYTFSWDTMLSFDGNSAPYLQYAYTRTQSLLKKAINISVIARSEATWQSPEPADPSKNESKNLSGSDQSSKTRTSALSKSEKALIKHFTQFPAVLASATTEYKPNLLCTYLFELAQSFSHFYNTDPILNAPNPEEIKFRLQLVQTFANILKRGLEILGIEVPERM